MTAFEQSVCVVYLPLFVPVAFSKPHNIFNVMEEFVEVCTLGIPLRISNFYGANFEIQSTGFFLNANFLFAQKRICFISVGTPFCGMFLKRSMFYQDAIFEN